MASEHNSKMKCFTFIWKLENASYCWQSYGECIESPSFTVDQIHETKWKLQLYPSIERNNNIEFYLRRQEDNKSLESVKIDCDLAFLSSDGTVLLHAYDSKNSEIGKNCKVGNHNVASRNEVFLVKRSLFLPQDTLTARCRIWNNVGMSQDVQCFARTRIIVEKRSFLWKIENFSTLKSHRKRSYEIKSHDNGKNFMSLELFLTGGLICDETVRFKITPNDENIKMSTFQLSIVDASENTVRCFRDEFWYHDPCGSKDFTLFCTKSELLEKKNTYLPNDVLSLWCECVFSVGTIQEEIEKIDSDCIGAIANKISDHRSLDEENEFSANKCILLDDLKSLMNNSCLSDVKLKTETQTYPAHKTILGARSPVFKAMFSNDMKEKINKCVDIEDFNDDTVLRMLRYIYSAQVGELEWTSAIELYVAADKYQILNLKDISSSYLKSNLVINNACEALVLADRHQDENLKGFVQDFILKHGKEIINSEEWDQLAETNLKLAYETMRLKFKK